MPLRCECTDPPQTTYLWVDFMFDVDHRVMVFIDGSNLHHAIARYREKNAQIHPNYQIDYEKLIHELVRGRKLVRVYFYGSKNVQPNPLQESFYAKLERLGFDVTVKPLKSRTRKCKNCEYKHQTHIEKGVDVALVTDLLAFGFRGGYDAAIIVSGDNDFLRAIEEVKRLPKRVEIACFGDSISQETQRKADEFIPLDTLVNKIRLNSVTNPP